MLPCGNWSESGSGYRYRDKFGTVGGVQRITYRAGKLVVSMKCAQTALLHGPVDYIDFVFGSERVLRRFEAYHQ
jgi:hypothetical protein